MPYELDSADVIAGVDHCEVYLPVDVIQAASTVHPQAFAISCSQIAFSLQQIRDAQEIISLTLERIRALATGKEID